MSQLGFKSVGDGEPIRAYWWCTRCKDDYFERKGADSWAPNVGGEQSTRCPECGNKLRRRAR